MEMILNSPAVRSRMHLIPKDGVVRVCVFEDRACFVDYLQA